MGFFFSSDIIFIFIVFLFLIFTFTLNTDNMFDLLVLSEFFWITLYVLSLLISVYYNNTQVLSLSLFFLMFSAAEISICLSSLVLYKSSNFSLKI